MNYYVEKRGANHGLHLVLTLLTCGLWAITGWPIAAILGRKRTVRGPAPYYPQYQQQPPPGPYPPPGYGPPPQQPPGPYSTPPHR
ncbi:hypothetical protein AB0B30_32580 [Streptomyces narbonensis]|uniref:Integral membrane protein n=1 Tax=Streptomyces narbonensis TaxID=67333 RepID=A0ABV3CIX5_9ACTN